ncbi:MAG: D-tyrosyl-tRNA(Tyr) deacylase [Acidimicrobiia bacterium]|nr:D-tyrosyl-tRNA(Tyr) deacylase [Acidimicrobiia bacterium]
MRAVVQRVSRAAVSVEHRVVGEIGWGLAVLLGVGDGDTTTDAVAVADKLVGLRIFADDEGKMNRSVIEHGGAVLLISQFTLLGDVRKGRRPSFVRAAAPDVADPLVRQVAERIAGHGVPVATGEFGAHMEVDLVNDGPVTIVIETADGRIH